MNQAPEQVLEDVESLPQVSMQPFDGARFRIDKPGGEISYWCRSRHALNSTMRAIEDIKGPQAKTKYTVVDLQEETQ